MEGVRSYDWITTKQAGNLVGCSVQHLRLLIRQGILSATRVGRDWLLDRSDVAALARNRCAGQRSKPEPLLELVPTLFYEATCLQLIEMASLPMAKPSLLAFRETDVEPNRRATGHE
jgi:excisionase family DNA binding protein